MLCVTESKRKRGDPNDKKEDSQTDQPPVSDDEGVVNDIDEYFEAGRDTRSKEQEVCGLTHTHPMVSSTFIEIYPLFKLYAIQLYFSTFFIIIIKHLFRDCSPLINSYSMHTMK